MTTFMILDRSGHSERPFKDDPDARAAGEALFKELQDKGFVLVDTSDPLVGKPPLKAYDPGIQEITAIPQFEGG